VVRIAFSDSELKSADKTLGEPVIGGSACPAHREHKAFLQEQMASLRRSKLLALVAMLNRTRHLKDHRLDGIRD
jgi:hypothetical protein